MVSTPIYHSKYFWHFCGNSKSEEKAYDTLVEIISSEMLMSPTAPDRSETEDAIECNNGNRLSTIPIGYVCFADIPFAFLGHHLEQYGNFGLAFDRNHVLNNDTFPVIYVPELTNKSSEKSYSSYSASEIISELCNSWYKAHKKTLNNKSDPEYSDTMSLAIKSLFLMKQIKQFDLSDPASPYYEREWRKLGSFKFKKKNIKTVVLPRKYTKRFSKKFPNIPYTISELVNS